MKPTVRQRSSSRVMWDEANLNYLELNKTPKRKITEPKTPYYAPGSENGSFSPCPDEDSATLDNAAHAKAVCNALTEVASTSGGHQSSGGGGWISSEDEADEMDRDYEGLGHSGHRLSFIEHRKAHYDEYRKIRSLRQQGSVINDIEDGNRKQESQDQEMLVDGIDSMGIQDIQSSGSCHRNCGRHNCK